MGTRGGGWMEKEESKSKKKLIRWLLMPFSECLVHVALSHSSISSSCFHSSSMPLNAITMSVGFS
jgi:hypothetical protein